MEESPVRCRELCVGYDGEPVLEDLSFSITRGETVAFVGRSGCGKTTLLKTLAGILPPIAGEGTILGRELSEPPPPGEVGYIPQRLGLVPHESVRTNVLHGRLSDLGPVRSILGRFPDEAEHEALEAIERVGLSGKEHDRVMELSGGQQRRVAIARAFVQAPRVLLADEMLSELDHETAMSIVRCVETLQADTGMAVILVEHNRSMADEISDVVLSVGTGGIESRKAASGNHYS